MSSARARIGCTNSRPARKASSVSQALVKMHRPDCRSTSNEIPTHPSTARTDGMTSSRANAIPASMAAGSV